MDISRVINVPIAFSRRPTIENFLRETEHKFKHDLPFAYKALEERTILSYFFKT